MKTAAEQAREIRKLVDAEGSRLVSSSQIYDLLDDHEEFLQTVEAFEENEVELNAALRKLLYRVEKLERVVEAARQFSKAWTYAAGRRLRVALRVLDRSEALDEIGRIGEKQRALDEEES